MKNQKKHKKNAPEFKTFTEFVKYHFGTKSEFAKQMKVSRPIAHKWCDAPGTMSVNQLTQIYHLTKDNGGDLSDLSELCLSQATIGEGEE